MTEHYIERNTCMCYKIIHALHWELIYNMIHIK